MENFIFCTMQLYVLEVIEALDYSVNLIMKEIF